MDKLKTAITSFVVMPDEEYDLILPLIKRIEISKDTNLWNKVRYISMYIL